MADGQQNPNNKAQEMTPQDYLRQIKANYPDLKQNLEMKVWVRIPCVARNSPKFILDALLRLDANFAALSDI
jgi:hypothetical protein